MDEKNTSNSPPRSIATAHQQPRTQTVSLEREEEKYEEDSSSSLSVKNDSSIMTTTTSIDDDPHGDDNDDDYRVGRRNKTPPSSTTPPSSSRHFHHPMENTENVVVWYVEPPETINTTIAELQRFVRRLQYAERTFEQRKQTMETILQRRSEGLDCYELVKTAFVAEQEALGENHVHLGDWYQLLANIDPKNAPTYLLTAYDIHQQALGSAHPRVGHDLILLAKCFDTNDIDTALHYYDLAVNVFCHIPLYG